MNRYPLVEMLIFFCRYSRLPNPGWRPRYTQHLKRIRSCHSKAEGGIQKSFYTVETKEGGIYDLEFNQEELLWRLSNTEAQKGLLADRLLVHAKRHKYLPSPAHRLVPLRFEIFPEDKAERKTPAEMALIDRLQPYRFLKGKHNSIQISRIETSHTENTMLTRHLHYVAEDTDRRFYHLVYVLDQADWRFVQEVDKEYLFVR